MEENKTVEQPKRRESNTLGIIGIATGWAFPLVGLVLGIISLAIKEKTKTLGIISIVESIVFWILWAIILLGVMGI